jgi:transposase
VLPTPRVPDGLTITRFAEEAAGTSGLMERVAPLQEKAKLRTGQSFRIIVVQEAGLDGFHKRGEPRVCAMVKVPTPDEEDRRHLCRERKALTAERVRHVNRIKGFLFSQGVSRYQPLRRDRRQRLERTQNRRRPRLASAS